MTDSERKWDNYSKHFLWRMFNYFNNRLKSEDGEVAFQGVVAVLGVLAIPTVGLFFPHFLSQVHWISSMQVRLTQNDPIELFFRINVSGYFDGIVG